MPMNCAWAQELMERVHKTCLNMSPLRGWIPLKMHIVDNPDLEEAFEDRKEELKKMVKKIIWLKFCVFVISFENLVGNFVGYHKMPHCKTKTLLQDCKTKILNIIIPRFLLALLDHMNCDYFWQYDQWWSRYW